MIEREYLNVIESMPDIYLYQFFKLSCYYLGLTEGAKNNLNTSSDKIVYINETAKAQMMLNKLLMISTNSIGVESQINNDSEKTNKAVLEAYEFLKKRFLSLSTTDIVNGDKKDDSENKFVVDDSNGAPVELNSLGLSVPTDVSKEELPKKGKVTKVKEVKVPESPKAKRTYKKRTKSNDNNEMVESNSDNKTKSSKRKSTKKK